MSWQQWSAAAQPSVPPVLNPAPPVINSAPSVVPPGLQYTPEQWAQLQQQNWHQWAQWQQQYQQWHQQYGAEYQKSMNALAQAAQAQQSTTSLPNLTVPPPLPVETKPPPPAEDPPPPLPSYNTAAPPPPAPQQQGYNTAPPRVSEQRPPVHYAKNNQNQNWQGQNHRYGPDAAQKRPYEQTQPMDHDAKRPMMNKPGWSNQQPPPMQARPRENIEELSEAEKKFDKQFAEWEAQFNKWKEQNVEHPDKEQYKEYEKKWESWRSQLLERREQMRRKRLGLTADSPKPKGRRSPTPHTHNSSQGYNQFPQSGYNQSPHQGGYNQSSQQGYNQPNQQGGYNQSPKAPQSVPPKVGDLMPTPNAAAPFSKPPPNMNDEPLKFKNAKPVPELDENVGDFIKPNTEGGIPGLDLVKDDVQPLQKENDDVVVIDPEEKEKEKKGPDFDAISKGINTILGDQKLLNMLSMVSQNQNPKQNDHLTNTVSRINEKAPETITQLPPFPEQSNQSFEEHSNNSETYGQREFVNNFDDQTRSSFTMAHKEETRFEGPGNIGRNQNQFQDRFGNLKGNRFGGPDEQFGRDRFPAGGPSQERFPPSGPNQERFPPGGPNQERFPAGGPNQGRFPPGGPNQERFPTGRSSQERFPPGGPNQERFPPGGPNQDRFLSRGLSQERFPPAGPGHERFQPAGPNHDRFPRKGPSQDRFPASGLNQDRFGPRDDRFGRDDIRFEPPENRFVARENRFGANQERFDSTQDRFGPNQDRFGPGQDRHTDRFGPGQDKFGPNQSRYGPVADRFGSKPDPVEVEDKLGPNQDGYGQKQDKFTPNQDKFGPNRDRFGSNQDKFGPQGRFGGNEDRYIPNRDKFEQNQDRFGANQDRGRFDPGQDRERFGQNEGRFGAQRDDFKSDDRLSLRNERNFGPRDQFNDDFDQGHFDDFKEANYDENYDDYDYDAVAANFENDEPNQPKDIVDEHWEKDYQQEKFNVPPVEKEPIPPTTPKDIFQATTVIDYEHKSAKQVEPEVLIEPIYMFDYRHKPLSRIPLPQRPKWLLESVKGIREFDPPIVRPYDPPRRYPQSSDNWRNDRYQENWPPHNRRNYEDRPSFKTDDRRPYGENRYEEPRKKWDERKSYNDDRNYHEERQQLVQNMDIGEEKISDTEWPEDDEPEREPSRVFPKFQKSAEPKPNANKNVVLIEDLISPPGRYKRPPRIVIILRGPPGSGKTYLAKLIKDKEVENGGSAPRILSLDDYFMVEQEKEVTEEGKKVKVKEMVYEYEAEMEESYRGSLIKSFKKTVTDGYFSFIIVDNVNDKVKYFGEMWSFAKQNGFQVYICQLDLDVQTCSKRNIHGRSEADIEKCVATWEATPSHHPILDATSLLQSASIPEVEMEEVNSPESDAHEYDGQEDQVARSKWDNFDCSVDNLAKLDGVSKPLRHRTMEEYLQLDTDWTPVKPTKPGQKRVRWADLEEQKQQEKMRAIGFVVGHTNWNRMMDPTGGSSALTQTKYIERTGRYKTDQK